MSRSVIAISVTFLLLLIGSGAYFIHKGFNHHVLSSSIKQWSKQKWNEGHYAESIKWFYVSYDSAFDADVRWTIVEEFCLGRMATFRRQGDLQNALSLCNQASKILGGDDDEGTVSYVCVEIEQEILNRNQSNRIPYSN